MSDNPSDRYADAIVATIGIAMATMAPREPEWAAQLARGETIKIPVDPNHLIPVLLHALISVARAAGASDAKLIERVLHGLANWRGDRGDELALLQDAARIAAEYIAQEVEGLHEVPTGPS